jgi:uncharacterized membrane protein
VKQINDDIKGFFNSRQWVGGLFTLFSFGGLFASWNLGVDRLIKLTNPGTTLNCDLNEYISCGKVDDSWQASLLHYSGVAVPNAMIGLIVYGVFITCGVALISGVKFPTWWHRAMLGGNIFAAIFAYWLLAQSYFALLLKPGDEAIMKYGALCPWCILLMFSTTIMLFALLHYQVLEDGLKLPKNLTSKWQHFIQSGMYEMVAIAWVLVLIIAILVKYHQGILGF